MSCAWQISHCGSAVFSVYLIFTNGPYMRCYTPLLIVLLCILTAGKLHASHYYGIDLYYTHISGNTYRVSLVAFGDCSGAQFPTFSTARPLIYIKRGATTVLQDFLNLEPPTAGVEVTAGCPADMKRTNCVDPSSAVPGVKKFVYSKNFTLPATAPDWKFVTWAKLMAHHWQAAAMALPMYRRRASSAWRLRLIIRCSTIHRCNSIA